jgi:LAO/AO transport system kinase
MMALTPAPEGAWKPPVLLAEAHRGRGISEVVAAVFRHRAWLETSGRLGAVRQARARRELVELLGERLLSDALARLGGEAGLDAAAGRIAGREADPYTVVDELLGRP